MDTDWLVISYICVDKAQLKTKTFSIDVPSLTMMSSV
jgi:hypothetical protein